MEAHCVETPTGYKYCLLILACFAIAPFVFCKQCDVEFAHSQCHGVKIEIKQIFPESHSNPPWPLEFSKGSMKSF